MSRRSSIRLEPLDALGILGRSLSIYRNGLGVFLIPNLLTITMVYVVFGVLFVANEDINLASLTLWVALSFYLSSFYGESIVAQMVADLYAGLSPSLSRAIRRVGSRIGCLTVTSLLTTVVSIVPPLIVWHVSSRSTIWTVLWISTIGLFTFACTFLSFPLIVIEQPNLQEGILRPFSLSSGLRGLIVGAVLLFCTLCIATLVMCLGLTMMIDNVVQTEWLGPSIGLTLPLFFLTIGSILKTVVYLDVRVKKEEYTEEELRREMGVSSPSSSSNGSGRRYRRMEDAGDEEDATEGASRPPRRSRSSRSTKSASSPAASEDSRQALV